MISFATIHIEDPCMNEDEWQEAERQHWNGKGHIEFFVIQNVPCTFEIEVTDWSGCAGGMDETMGIDWMIKEWGIQDELREGVTYTLHDLTVEWTRGDGWEIDDDVEYDFTHITSHATALSYLSHKEPHDLVAQGLAPCPSMEK